MKLKNLFLGSFALTAMLFAQSCDDKNDGPTKTLLRYIKKYNKIAPSEWDGYRKLEAKC